MPTQQPIPHKNVMMQRPSEEAKKGRVDIRMDEQGRGTGTYQFYEPPIIPIPHMFFQARRYSSKIIHQILIILGHEFEVHQTLLDKPMHFNAFPKFVWVGVGVVSSPDKVNIFLFINKYNICISLILNNFTTMFLIIGRIH